MAASLSAHGGKRAKFSVHRQFDRMTECELWLTSSQRTAYTKRRRQIWEALHPVKRVELGGASGATQLETDSRGQRKSPQQTKSFAASTAAATGMTKSSINRHLARAEALGDETLSKITGTSLDAGVEMDALAKQAINQHLACTAPQFAEFAEFARV